MLIAIWHFLVASPLLLVISSFTDLHGIVSNMEERVYFDESDLSYSEQEECFHIHIGENIWLVSNVIHRDGTGTFTFDVNLRRHGPYTVESAYEKKWKCPYCHRFWPEGTPCQNPDCPSKYK